MMNDECRSTLPTAQLRRSDILVAMGEACGTHGLKINITFPSRPRSSIGNDCRSGRMERNFFEMKKRKILNDECRMSK